MNSGHKISFNVSSDRVKKATLANGMTILAFKNPVVPKVMVQIAYDIGSAVEQAGEKGLAHLLEHMIFKGTDKLAEGDIDSIARKYGASFNAYTSKDVTSYYFEVDKNNWKPFLPILADCMQNARFDEQHLASELLAVIQELKMYKDRHISRMLEKAEELVFPTTHPYHYPVIGYKEDLAAVTSDRLRDFYKKYYHPGHATLFIVGDIDPDDAIAAARHEFEGIKSTVKAPVTHYPPVISDLTVHNTKIYESVQKEQFAFYWVIPGIKTGNEPLVASLCFILGQTEGSRLSKRMIDDEQVADSVIVDTDHAMESGVFLVLVVPKDGQRERCEEIVTEEINKVIEHGVTAQELQKMVLSESTTYFHMMENIDDFTDEWIRSYFATRNEHDVFKRIEQYQAVTSDDIKTFTADYLSPFLMNSIDLVSLPEERKHLWEAAKAHSDALDAQILKGHVRTTPVEEPKYVLEMADPVKLEFTFPKPTKILKLANGLEVIFHKSDLLPLVSVNCQFRSSSYFSSSKEGVVVDLMMSLLIEGSRGFSKEDNVSFFETRGVEYGFSALGGKLSLLSTDLTAILERFSHVLQHPLFEADALEKCKELAIDSYERTKDSARAVAVRALRNMIFKNHPYEWNFDEAIELINNLTPHELTALHAQHIAPEQMVLSIAGSFDEAQLEKDITKIFGSWTGTPYQEIVYPVRSFKPHEQHDVFMLRDQVVFMLGQPSAINIFNPDLVPLKMLNLICFESLGSRIYELRERTGLFYNAHGSWAAGADREYGYDYIMAIVSPEKVDQAEDMIKQAMAEVKNKGVTQDEVLAARQIYLKALIDVGSHIDSIASLLASFAVMKLGFDYYDNVLAKVQQLNATDLNQLAQSYCDTSKMARIRVGRVGKEPAEKK